jgi:hypothetical protein
MASEVQEGKLPLIGDASTLRPFGNAFYLERASYSVWNLKSIIAFTTIVKTFTVTFHAFPLLLGLHSAAAILYGWSFEERDYQGLNYPFIALYFMILLMFLFSNLLRVVLWVVIELTAKWTLMGKRLEGRYNYDTSSYAQRWELYQTIAHMRKFSRMNFMDFFSGTPFMSAFFRWNGGTIGRDCCLYPSGSFVLCGDAVRRSFLFRVFHPLTSSKHVHLRCGPVHDRTRSRIHGRPLCRGLRIYRVSLEHPRQL